MSVLNIFWLKRGISLVRETRLLTTVTACHAARRQKKKKKHKHKSVGVAPPNTRPIPPHTSLPQHRYVRRLSGLVRALLPGSPNESPHYVYVGTT